MHATQCWQPYTPPHPRVSPRALEDYRAAHANPVSGLVHDVVGGVADWAGEKVRGAVGAAQDLGGKVMEQVAQDPRVQALVAGAKAVGHWVNENKEYILACAAIVGGVALMCTGVGGPAGVALMAASGGLISGGISVAAQKASTGSVDWKQAGKDTLTGALTGAAGGVGFTAGKAAAAGIRAGGGQLVKGLAINAGVNGVAGATGSSAEYLITHHGHVDDMREFLSTVSGGGIASAMGSAVGPAGGSITKRMGHYTKSSSIYAKLPSKLTNHINFNATGNAATAVRTVGNMGAGMVGSVSVDILGGKDIDLKKAGVTGVSSGFAFHAADNASKIPKFGNYLKQNNVNTIKQFKYFAPRSLSGLTNMSSRNTYGLYGSAVNGATMTVISDLGTMKAQGLADKL